MKTQADSVTVGAWLPVESAELWEIYVVTDGRFAAVSQRSEADDGTHYWAVDPEDGLDWEPTHLMPLPTSMASSSDGELPCPYCLETGHSAWNCPAKSAPPASIDEDRYVLREAIIDRGGFTDILFIDQQKNVLIKEFSNGFERLTNEIWEQAKQYRAGFLAALTRSTSEVERERDEARGFLDAALKSEEHWKIEAHRLQGEKAMAENRLTKLADCFRDARDNERMEARAVAAEAEVRRLTEDRDRIDGKLQCADDEVRRLREAAQHLLDVGEFCRTDDTESALRGLRAALQPQPADQGEGV